MCVHLADLNHGQGAGKGTGLNLIQISASLKGAHARSDFFQKNIRLFKRQIFLLSPEIFSHQQPGYSDVSKFHLEIFPQSLRNIIIVWYQKERKKYQRKLPHYAVNSQIISLYQHSYQSATALGNVYVLKQFHNYEKEKLCPQQWKSIIFLNVDFNKF